MFDGDYKQADQGNICKEKVYVLRGKHVILASDIAKIYCVSTKILSRTLERNKDCFPEDFAFHLNSQEIADLSQRRLDKGLLSPPYAFTANGILMVSSLLNTPQAIQINIFVMRTISKIQDSLFSNELNDDLDVYAKVLFTFLEMPPYFI